jgi:hypothetical protein
MSPAETSQSEKEAPGRPWPGYISGRGGVWHDPAWPGTAWPGPAGSGEARLGKAWRGKVR